MRLSTYLPRLVLYWAAKLNGAHLGNGRDYWQAPVLSVVAMSAPDQDAMDHLIESFRFWAATYEPRQPKETPRCVEPPFTVTLMAAQACEALCRRPSYPKE